MAGKDGKELTDKLVKQGDQPPRGTFQEVMTRELTKSFKAIKSVVPEHVTPERLMRVSLNAVSRNPKLAECAPETIVGAIMNCAILGLEPNLIGHAYIIPFWNGKTKRMEAQFQVGYKGVIELFRNTGEVATITAHEVCVNDVFKVTYGVHEDLVHEPAPWGIERGEVVGYYSTFKLKDGSYGFCPMSKNEVEQHRDKYTKSKDRNGKITGPWADPDQFHEMAKKTCILKMSKYMPVSIEKQQNKNIMEALNRDGGVITSKESELGFGDAFLDVQYTVVGNDDNGDVNKGAEPEPSKDKNKDGPNKEEKKPEGETGNFGDSTLGFEQMVGSQGQA